MSTLRDDEITTGGPEEAIRPEAVADVDADDADADDADDADSTDQTDDADTVDPDVGPADSAP